MDLDLSTLWEHLADAGTDGYLFDTDDFDANQYYLTGFTAPDGVTSLHTSDGSHLLTNALEYGRATNESRTDSVAVSADYDARELRQEYGEHEGRNRVLKRFLEDHEISRASVPGDFPLVTADGLRELGVELEPTIEDVIEDLRAVKTDEEIESLRDVQAANQSAMATVERVLRESTVEDGTLHYEGEVLTSERVKVELETTLLGERCGLDEAIVACGSDGAEPHNRGSGPIKAGKPIVVDIFPWSKSTRYYGDMTRTFVKGEPGEKAREWYDLTHEAFEAAMDAVKEGVTGEAVHGAACDVFEDAGLSTLRTDPTAETGFIHSTGHGVGLEIHEQPGLNEHAEEPLQAGHVITVEPGLYDPDVGGIRIEDMVVVTEDGYDNLTDYPIEFVVE